MTDVTKGIKTVLEAMLSSGLSENSALVAQFQDEPAIIEARKAAEEHDIDGFFFALPYPVSNLINGVIESTFPGNSDAQFLMANSRFLENHLDRIFSRFEGGACSHDKTRTVLQALLHHFVTKEPIKFNYDQEYTYGLPKIVLKDHDSIIEFFKGLEFLHYGIPDRYLKALQEITAPKAETPKNEA